MYIRHPSLRRRVQVTLQFYYCQGKTNDLDCVMLLSFFRPLSEVVSRRQRPGTFEPWLNSLHPCPPVLRGEMHQYRTGLLPEQNRANHYTPMRSQPWQYQDLNGTWVCGFARAASERGTIFPRLDRATWRQGALFGKVTRYGLYLIVRGPSESHRLALEFLCIILPESQVEKRTRSAQLVSDSFGHANDWQRASLSHRGIYQSDDNPKKPQVDSATRNSTWCIQLA